MELDELAEKINKTIIDGDYRMAICRALEELKKTTGNEGGKEMNKRIASMFSVNDAMHAIKGPNDNCFFKIEETIVTQHAKMIDKYIIEQLYETYKGTEISKVFVIDMTEFEAFLRQMLPVWMEDQI